MNFRIRYYHYCIVILAFNFIPSLIRCMDEPWPENAFTMDSLAQIGGCDWGANSSVGEGECAEINFPVNNIQQLEVAIRTLIQLSKNHLPRARTISLAFAGAIAKDIEKIYKQNGRDITEIIQQNHAKLNPELQRIFDDCLAKCGGRAQHFANRCACSVYAAMVLFSFIICFALQEKYL
jgi:hypothetical protein